MIINSKIKNTSDAIDYLNRAVFGDDPETSVLTRVYEGDTPIQDRVTAVENSAALVDVQALKDKVDELSELTEVFANLAYPMPNLVVNGNLTLDSNSDGIPDGFSYSANTTDKTMINGVATFTATSQFGRLQQTVSFNANDLIYYYARVKASSNLVYLVSVVNLTSANTYHSGNNEFQFLSNIQTASGSFNTIQVGDMRTSGFTPIQVDYIGAYNVSTMKLKGIKNDDGIPFTLLTNGQIKTQLDLWVQTRFPLDVLLMMRS